MKKKIFLLTALFTILSSLNAAASGDITVYKAPDGELSVDFNGQEVPFTDADPFIDENDRTQLPVRVISEFSGAKVTWDDAEKTITIVNDNTTSVMTIGSTAMTVNGEVITMDTAPVIVNDRTYVPALYLGTALKYTINYSEDRKTITDSQTGISMGVQTGSVIHEENNELNIEIFDSESVPEYITEALNGETADKTDENGFINLNDGVAEYEFTSTFNNFCRTPRFTGAEGDIVIEYIPVDIDEYDKKSGNYYTTVDFGVSENTHPDFVFSPRLSESKISLNEHSFILIKGVNGDQYYTENYAYHATIFLTDFESKSGNRDKEYKFKVRVALVK